MVSLQRRSPIAATLVRTQATDELRELEFWLMAKQTAVSLYLIARIAMEQDWVEVVHQEQCSIAVLGTHRDY